MGNYTVYMHLNKANDKKYIGITSKEPYKRFQNGKGYRNNGYFNNAIEKYGWENMRHEILEQNLEKEEAELKEKEYILKFQSNKRKFGYNITSGGEVIGKHSEESKRKMSEKLKGKKSRLGAKHTNETKRKMSQSKKGRVMKKGWNHSEKTIEKMRKNHADFSGEKNPRYGIPHTIESRKKISENRIYKIGGEHPTAKLVCQYSLEGNFIRYWESLSTAMRDFREKYSGSIKPCCLGKTKTAYGYVWKYKEAK
jgi:group I intron endonuclease